MTVEVVHYFDYKSPYAYLAQDATDAIERNYDIIVTRIPYTLNILDFLGEARLGPDGRDEIGTRSAHQWRRVRYSYMDCRREANRRGLTVRGPQKIWDSRLAHIGFLYAQAQGDFRRYHDTIYTRFWKRELDIENFDMVRAILAECGLPLSGFAAFADGPGRAQLNALQLASEDRGVFGVPSWTVNNELFWGSERLDLINEALSRRA